MIRLGRRRSNNYEALQGQFRSRWPRYGNKIPHLMSFPETWTLVGVAVAVEDMIPADCLVHPRTLDHPGKTEMVSGHQHARYEERKEETMR